MKLLDDLMNKKAELQIAPLIDVVFLLLIYFMVTASMIKKEADLSFMLPPITDTSEPVAEPLEVLIEVSEIGEISINGIVYGQTGVNLDDLVATLITYREAAKASKSEFIVSILPSDKALHGRIIRVMDACAVAKVKNMSFSMAM